MTTQGEDHKQLLDKKVASVQLKDMDGKAFNTAELGFDGPVIISFWATWCKPCLRELQVMNANLATWQAETNVKIVTISVDDARTKNRVPAVIKSKKWNFAN